MFPPFSREELAIEYKSKNKFGFLMAIMHLPFSLAEGDETVDLSEVNPDDYDEFNANQIKKCKQQMINNTCFRQRIVDILNYVIINDVLKHKTSNHSEAHF